MINFLRKIRKGLLAENNLSKYLVYALGEIILVVLGILIALQINTWNEGRKSKAFEMETLRQIRSNMSADKLSLKEIVNNLNQSVHASRKILESTWTQEEKDSLQYWLGDIFQYDRFRSLTNAYEVAKSKGLDLISNKQLRFLLGDYYDSNVQNTMLSVGDIERAYNEEWQPILQDEMIEMKFKHYVRLRDASLFKEGERARNLLIINKENYHTTAADIKTLIISIDRIHDLITQELKK